MTYSQQDHSTYTVSEDSSQKWQSVRSNSRERLSRVAEILKAASKETLVELKAGTAEIDGVSREALEKLIAEHKETDFNQDSVRGWQPLLWDLGGVVQERKSGVLQPIAVRLAEALSHFDAEMSRRYGDRYRPVSSPVSWLQTRLSRYGSQSDDTEVKRVEIEVVD